MAKDYQAIYTALEVTMRRLSSPPGQFDRGLAEFMAHHGAKHETGDDDYYWRIVQIAFYSGMNAETVSEKLPAIQKWLYGYDRVSKYDEAEIAKMMLDTSIIRHEKKIRGCVKNAKAFKEIVASHGSFAHWISSFSPDKSFDNVLRLRDALRERFAFLGPTTVYHLMTDVGLPVLKPDRVVRRIFHRLGITASPGESDKELAAAVEEGREFARITGKPIREIDIVFVCYGQLAGNTDFGLAGGVCLEKKPKCNICGLQPYCDYFAKRGQKSLDAS